MSAGYAFVPLPDRVLVRERTAAVHDRRVRGTLSGRLEVTLVTEQPVHVGSGYKGLVDGKAVRRGALVGGVPGVPGSSLKGVVRSRYEAITRSCIPGGAKANWKVRSRTFGLDGAPARLTMSVRDKEVFCAQEYPRDLMLCPACALWGRMSFRSRVSVTDFVSLGVNPFEISKMPKQFGPNLHHVGPFKRNTGGGRGDHEPAIEVHDLHGRKFALCPGPATTQDAMELVEAIPRRAQLRGEMRLKNVLPAELGGLLIALGWGRPRDRSALKLGGGKALGFGRLRVSSITYRLHDHAGKDVLDNELGWCDAFERSDDCFPPGLKKLVEIHQGNC